MLSILEGKEGKKKKKREKGLLPQKLLHKLITFQSTEHVRPATTCQTCLFLGRAVLQQSMKKIWESVNSKSFQCKPKHLQCTHEKL